MALPTRRRPRTIDAIMKDIEARSGITVSPESVASAIPVRTTVEPVVARSDAPKKSSRERAEEFRRNAAEAVVQAVLENRASWQKPWSPEQGLDFPINAVTGKPYRGGNSEFLSATAPSSDPRWATYKQANEAGWQVRKGEKGQSIEYWENVTREKSPEKMEKDRTAIADNKPRDGRTGETITEPSSKETVLVHKTYTVFHASQIDGIPERTPDQIKPVPPRHELAQKIAASVGAPIVENQAKAAYSPQLDQIYMPSRAAFTEPGAYEGTLLHEAGHATGHISRLNRPGITDKAANFGSIEYAKEELRAEMTSALLAREIGVPHDPSQHAAYAKNWAQVIKEDPNELFRAATDAQKIATYMVETARSKGVEVELGPNSVIEAVRAVAEKREEQKQAVTAPETKKLGEDVHRWTGKITEISEDRTSATMYAAGRKTIIAMPEGQTVPESLEKGDFGKMIAGKDGAALKFEKIEKKQDRSNEIER